MAFYQTQLQEQMEVQGKRVTTYVDFVNSISMIDDARQSMLSTHDRGIDDDTFWEITNFMQKALIRNTELLSQLNIDSFDSTERAKIAFVREQLVENVAGIKVLFELNRDEFTAKLKDSENSIRSLKNTGYDVLKAVGQELQERRVL